MFLHFILQYPSSCMQRMLEYKQINLRACGFPFLRALPCGKHLCINVADSESLATLIPRLAQLVRSGVGLNTRFGHISSSTTQFWICFMLHVLIYFLSFLISLRFIWYKQTTATFSFQKLPCKINCQRIFESGNWIWLIFLDHLISASKITSLQYLYS